ncbi:MAG: MlaD family protein [Polyangia bacterium]
MTSPGRWRPSLVWALPALVVLLGVVLAIRTFRQRGSTVTITFATADGLEPNKTTIRYKSVVVGIIKRIDLLENRSGVAVTTELSPQMTPLLVEDARFWVVRPRVSATGISGMGTLLAGAHVAFDAGVSPTSRREFVGLESIPSTVSERRGRRFTLRAENLGSVDVGSPLYLHRFQVGQVSSVALAADGNATLLEVFVDAPYNAHVTADTRFWNASGVDLTMDARGIKLDTQSLASMITGGVAFETPALDGPGESPTTPLSAAPGSTFPLFADRTAALRAPSRGGRTFLLSFKRPPGALMPGSPVELLGLEVGEVLGVDSDFDARTAEPRTLVTLTLRQERIRLRQSSAPASLSPPVPSDGITEMLTGLVQRGLRGRIRTSNVLTGRRYVALDIVPRAPRSTVALDWSRQQITLPSFEGPSDDLVESMTRLVAKMDKVPVEELVREGTLATRQMRRTFEQTSLLMGQLSTDVTPRLTALMGQTQKTLGSVESTLDKDAPLQRDLRTALKELSKAGRSVGSLAGYLERHPQSLIWGK